MTEQQKQEQIKKKLEQEWMKLKLQLACTEQQKQEQIKKKLEQEWMKLKLQLACTTAKAKGQKMMQTWE